MSPALFHTFVELVRQWQVVSVKDFEIGDTVSNRILLADDHVIFIESKDELQRTVSRFENTENAFDTRISATKTKIIAFYVGNHERRKINFKKIIEQMSSFNYLGFNLSYCLIENINI